MSDSQIEKISSKSVLHAKLFDVEEHHLKLKSGREVTHHVVKRLPVVVIFPITNNYDIYLVSEYREMFGKTILAAAAGFMDKEGEKSLDAAKREAKEELGITASQWEQFAKVELAGSVINGQANLFLARDIEKGDQSPEDDEQIEVVKMPLEEAVRKVMLGEINNSATIIGILMLDKMRKEKKL